MGIFYLLLIVWILAIIVISYIIITETKRLKNKDECQHKSTGSYTNEKGTKTMCLDYKTKIKNKKL